MWTKARFAGIAALASVLLVSGAAGAGTPTNEYLITETTGTTLADSGPATTQPLTIAPGAGSFSSIGSGNGFTFASDSCAITGGLTGTKIATSLAGQTKVTFEAVVDTSLATSYNIIVAVESAASYDVVVGLATGTTLQVCLFGPSSSIVCVDLATGLHRITGVIDTTQAVAANRLVLYADGTTPAVETNPTATVYPVQNTQLDAGFTDWSTNRLAVGCLVAGSVQSFVGPIYYATVYGQQALGSEAGSHSTTLAGNNDSDPNGGGGGGGTVYPTIMMGDSSGSLAWNWWSPPCVIVGPARGLPAGVVEGPLMRAHPVTVAWGRAQECSL